MQVIALEECFAAGAIRRPGCLPFEFTPPPDGSIPSFLQVVSKAPTAAPDSDIYATLSDDQIRRRLEDCLVKVPPLADRQRLVVLLAETEGKEVPKAKPKKGDKK